MYDRLLLSGIYSTRRITPALKSTVFKSFFPVMQPFEIIKVVEDN
jgi:hypothetical protein